MSVLRRPDGDAIAQKFGAYKTESEVRNLVAGDKLDVLCDGGIHYVAKVVNIDQFLNGQLHFCKWNEKYDHFGSFKELYLAEAGQYSAGTLNGANQFIDPNDTSSSRKKTSHSVNEEGGATGPSYAEKTRYEDDYLFKPYRSDRKRRSMDSLLQASRGSESGRDDEASLPSAKRVATTLTGAVATQGIGEAGVEAVALDSSDQRSPVAPVDTVGNISLHDSSGTISSELAGDNQVLPDTADGAHVVRCGGSSLLQDEVCGGGDHKQGDNGQMASRGQATDIGRSEGGAVGASGPGVTLRAMQPARARVEYVAAANPLVVSGGRTLPRWRHFYQQMLRDSGDAECGDVAAAMEWLDTHLDAARSRGTVKGKVYGPLGMLCVTHDVHSAVMLEHAIRRRLLLGFLVDRLQDQQYLEDQLVSKQGLNVKVWFSGTRDRFDGYKALAPTYANPVAGCELTNLGDRLMCGQLIRNLAHSEGCTGQMVLGGTLAAGAGMDGSAALKNVFSRAGAANAGRVVVYLAEGGGSEQQVRRYTYEPGAAGEAGAQVQIEPVPLLPSQSDTAGGRLRLLYSYSEQVERAETVPAHLVTVSAPPAPSMSSKHSAIAVASYTTQARAATTTRTSSSAAPRQAGLAPHRAHLAAQSFAGLGEYDAARAAAGALALRTASGGIAVWHLLSKHSGLWFPSRAALAKDLQQQAGPGGSGPGGAANGGRDSAVPVIEAQGLFVALAAFTQRSSPENGELGGEPTFFGHTWPLELASFPGTFPGSLQANVVSSDNVSDAMEEADADPERAGATNKESGTGSADVTVKEETTAVERVVNSGEVTKESQDEESGMDVAEVEGVGEGPEPLPLDIVPYPLPLDAATGLPVLSPGTESNADCRPADGAADGAAGVTAGEPVGGRECCKGEDPAAGAGGAEQGGSMLAEGSRVTVEGGGPHLALNKKTGVIGLAFLTSDAFRAWHKTALAENGEDFELTQVATDKVAFLALASIRGSAEYYDLRLLKRKHTALFSTREPRQAGAVCALLRRNSETAAHSEYSLRNGGGHSHSGGSSSAHRASASGLSPLPLSVLMRGGGPSVAGIASTQLSWQQPAIANLPPASLKIFKGHLANDATIANLESSLNHLGAVSAELARAGVDVACLRKLLSAQLQLARATRLVLK